MRFSLRLPRFNLRRKAPQVDAAEDEIFEEGESLALAAPADHGSGIEEPPEPRDWRRLALIGAVVLAFLGTASVVGYSLFGGKAGEAQRIVMKMPPRSGPELPGSSLLTPPPRVAAPGEAAPAPAGSPSPDGTAPPPPETAAPVAPEPPKPPPPPRVPGIPTARTPGLADLPQQKDPKPLPPAPIEGMFRDSSRGRLPVVAADGRRAATVYARPFAGDAGKPRIAVVITDLGLAKEATEAAIQRLPGEVSLSFSPHARDIDAWVAKARQGGHEVLIGLPLQPPGFPAHDSGPGSLLLDMPLDETMNRLEGVLGRAVGYVGVAATPGSALDGSEQLAVIAANLAERGLIYVGPGIGQGVSQRPPTASVGVVADADPFRAAIDARLEHAIHAAQRDGGTVVLAKASPLSLDRLLAWFATLGDKGVVLAPASAVAR